MSFQNIEIQGGGGSVRNPPDATKNAPKSAAKLGNPNLFQKSFLEKRVNETTHNIGVVDQKVTSDSNFNHFL